MTMEWDEQKLTTYQNMFIQQHDHERREKDGWVGD